MDVTTKAKWFIERKRNLTWKLKFYFTWGVSIMHKESVTLLNKVALENSNRLHKYSIN